MFLTGKPPAGDAVLLKFQTRNAKCSASGWRPTSTSCCGPFPPEADPTSGVLQTRQQLLETWVARGGNAELAGVLAV